MSESPALALLAEIRNELVAIRKLLEAQPTRNKGVQPVYADPTAVCGECGEMLGFGHLESCPRLPAIVN